MSILSQSLMKSTITILAAASAGLAIAAPDWREALQKQGYYSALPTTVSLFTPPQSCALGVGDEPVLDATEQLPEPPIVLVILGTDALDVRQIDPSSLLLEGVPPTRWALMDAASPSEASSGPVELALDCNGQESGVNDQQQGEQSTQGNDNVEQGGGMDGRQDLILNFNRRKLRKALGDATDGEELDLMLIGNFKEQFDGALLEGNTAVILRKNAP